MLNDNPSHLSTLSHLDLSHNNLKDDVHVSIFHTAPALVGFIFFQNHVLNTNKVIWINIYVNNEYFVTEFI